MEGKWSASGEEWEGMGKASISEQYADQRSNCEYS
jgi:hypothetical protein